MCAQVCLICCEGHCYMTEQPLSSSPSSLPLLFLSLPLTFSFFPSCSSPSSLNSLFLLLSLFPPLPLPSSPSSLLFQTKSGHSPTNLICSEAICAGSQRVRPKTNRGLRSVESAHTRTHSDLLYPDHQTL